MWGNPFMYLLVVLIPVVVWKGQQARRTRENVGLRAVFVALVLGTVLCVGSVPLQFPRLAEALSAPVNFFRLTTEVCLVGQLAAIHFFHLETGRRTTPRRRRTDIAVLALVIVLIVGCAVLAPPPAGLELTGPNMASPATVVYYSISSMYLLYLILTQLNWAGRYALRAGIPGLMRAAAAVIAIGVLFGIFTVVTRLVLVIGGAVTGRLPTGLVPFVALTGTLGLTMTAIGLALPVLRWRARRAATWLLQLRYWWQLRRLWRTVAAAYPSIIRPRRPSSVPPPLASRLAQLAADPAPQPRQTDAVAGVPQPEEGVQGRWGVPPPPPPSRLRFAYQMRVQQCRDGVIQASSSDSSYAVGSAQARRVLMEAISLHPPVGGLSATSTPALLSLSRQLPRHLPSAAPQTEVRAA